MPSGPKCRSPPLCPPPWNVMTISSLAGPIRVVLAQKNLGKPLVVSGECRVELTTLLQALPSGNYRIEVRAINGSGASMPASSDVFAI